MNVEGKGLSGARTNSETGQAERQAAPAANGKGGKGRAGRAKPRTRLDGGHDGPPSPKGPFGRLRAELDGSATGADAEAIAGPPPAYGASGGLAERPRVDVSRRGDDVTQAAADALGSHPGLFVRGGLIVRISRDCGRGQSLYPPGSPRIEPAPLPSVWDGLADSARFVVGGVDGERRVSPPKWLATAVHSCGVYPAVRRINGLVECPTIRPDGSILQVAGWDESTCLVHEPNGVFGPVPERPTRDDALEAAGSLLALFDDVPFATGSDRSSALGLILTLVGRHGIDGPTPMTMIDANLAGAGKTLVAATAVAIATGRHAAVTPTSGDGEELKKLVASIAMEGRSYVLLDNQDNGGTVGSRVFDQVLTSRVWSDRLLGSNRTCEVPINACWIMTGNNLAVRGDLARRVVRVRLESPVERPELRTGFRHPDLIAHVLGNRGRYVRDALTVLRAHAVAGWPRHDGPAIGSFEAWDERIRSALMWLGLPDPLASAEAAREDALEIGERAALIDALAGLPLIRTRGLTSAEILNRLRDRPDEHHALREVLGGHGVDPARPKADDANTLGLLLRRHRGGISGPLRLERGGRSGGGPPRWRVADLAGGPPREADAIEGVAAADPGSLPFVD